MWFYAFIFLYCLLRSHCAGNTVDCFKKEKSLGVLDLAKDSIKKAKDLYPNCSEDEHSTNATGCGKKEKALAFLEIASNLINEAKKNYPTCNDSEPMEPTETPRSTGTPGPTKTQVTTETQGSTETPGTTEPARTSEAPMFGNPIDCTDVLRYGRTKSGIYKIRPSSNLFYNKSINVYCDMDTDGGGWTVIQRRGNFSEMQDFYLDWEDYKRGFGDLRGEFWLGNDNISAISNQGRYAVRFDLEDFEGNKRFAKYSSFRIENEAALYRLHVSGYSGNAGDSMGYDNYNVFCTRDRPNGKVTAYKDTCASSRRSGWWMDLCNKANLNGMRKNGSEWDTTNMYWKEWKGFGGLAAADIKLRRAD